MTAVNPVTVADLVAEARTLAAKAIEDANWARTGYGFGRDAEVRDTVLSAFENLDAVEAILGRLDTITAAAPETGSYAEGWADRSRATPTVDAETTAIVAEHFRAARFRDRPSGRPIADTVFGHDDFTRRAAALLTALPHSSESH